MTNQAIRQELDSDGILTLTIDCPVLSMNVINEDLTRDLVAAVDRIKTDAAVKGAVIISGKACLLSTRGWVKGAGVAPVGEQGADIGRVAAMNADYAGTTAGVQINRFCASGLDAVNMAAAKVISGEAEFAIGGGVESMSRVPMGSDGCLLYTSRCV